MPQMLITAEAPAEQKADLLAKRLAGLLAIATAFILLGYSLYGPRLTEIALPDGLCAFAKANFVYVGTPKEGHCQWMVMTDSHGWVSTNFQGHFLQMRASWNAAQVRFDGQLHEIGEFREPSDEGVTHVITR